MDPECGLAPQGLCSLGRRSLCGGNALEPMLEREFERPAFCAAKAVAPLNMSVKFVTLVTSHPRIS